MDSKKSGFAHQLSLKEAYWQYFGGINEVKRQNLNNDECDGQIVF